MIFVPCRCEHVLLLLLCCVCVCVRVLPRLCIGPMRTGAATSPGGRNELPKSHDHATWDLSVCQKYVPWHPTKGAVSIKSLPVTESSSCSEFFATHAEYIRSCLDFVLRRHDHLSGSLWASVQQTNKNQYNAKLKRTSERIECPWGRPGPQPEHLLTCT